MDECDWTSCGALARLDLMAGSGLSAARVVGSFCVPHASMASLDVQEQAGEPTWYDWHRERAPVPLAGKPIPQRNAAVIPLFHQRTAADSSRPGRRVGRARSR
ncbi:MAG TPA: hypothetical protein VE776_00940 [Actinomycetota bacterium]|jgi:hypothetical protein|nr:hypothetical protein [Actinomycetota bacterium]